MSTKRRKIGMKTSTDGLSILIAYRNYRKNLFFVNRVYQRKLVWTVSEKELLIDSILKQYALPSFLFLKDQNKDTLEILDGVQRLSAIFEFIENKISINGRYFDIDTFPFAKNLQSNGVFPKLTTNRNLLLPADVCTDFLNFTISTNTISASSEETIDLFRRINSQGHSLSNQDRRRSGVATNFATLVDEIATTLRGDISQRIVNLKDMPSISLDDQRSKKGYKISIEDSFWFKTGILRRDNLVKSEDEEFIADLAASVISGNPFSASQENFNKLYDSNSSMSQSIETQLNSQGMDTIKEKIETVFSFVNAALITNQPDKKTNFQQVVSSTNHNHNPSKYAFYAFFMAFYNLIYHKNKVPSNFSTIWKNIAGLESKLAKGSHSIKISDRATNITLVEGLLNPGFVFSSDELKKYSDGQILKKILEDSSGETERFEFKLGLYSFNPQTQKATFNKGLVPNITKKATSFANTLSHKSSYIMIGIADSDSDSYNVSQLGIEPFKIGPISIVGIKRDLILSHKSLDEYYQHYFSALSQEPVSEEMMAMLKNIKSYTYNGATVLSIKIDNTGKPEPYNDKYYRREGTNTVELDTPEIISLTQNLQKQMDD